MLDLYLNIVMNLMERFINNTYMFWYFAGWPILESCGESTSFNNSNKKVVREILCNPLAIKY